MPGNGAEQARALLARALDEEPAMRRTPAELTRRARRCARRQAIAVVWTVVAVSLCATVPMLGAGLFASTPAGPVGPSGQVVPSTDPSLGRLRAAELTKTVAAADVLPAGVAARDSQVSGAARALEFVPQGDGYRATADLVDAEGSAYLTITIGSQPASAKPYRCKFGDSGDGPVLGEPTDQCLPVRGPGGAFGAMLIGQPATDRAVIRVLRILRPGGVDVEVLCSVVDSRARSALRSDTAGQTSKRCPLGDDRILAIALLPGLRP
ncbi:hypothetical protein F0L68_20655 [Solihabitans fulvus]|uniref:Uncharacterized protein n=1 Tax=Solihabitans fulvus TaxID=1892852 RepID=A0A5B2X9H3_9PSEU|nr:hypothetical protein [Solihabitans fulvus]KAA2260137.1 hypothetical protein F0L68_20655 [Solihabitans fulvus]